MDECFRSRWLWPAPPWASPDLALTRYWRESLDEMTWLVDLGQYDVHEVCRSLLDRRAPPYRVRCVWEFGGEDHVVVPGEIVEVSIHDVDQYSSDVGGRYLDVLRLTGDRCG